MRYLVCTIKRPNTYINIKAFRAALFKYIEVRGVRLYVWGSNKCAMELKGTNKIKNSSIELLFYLSSIPGSRHTIEVEKYRDLSTLNSSSRALGNVVMNFVEPGWMVHDGCVHLLITMRVFKP